MGIIERQTIKGTVYSYLGVIIGFVNLAILSPKIFTTDQIGLTQVMVAIAIILAQVGGLGFNNVTNRLFPYFRNYENNHNGFLSLSFLVTFSGFLISLAVLLLYMPRFIEANADRSLLLSNFAYYIPVLLGLLMMFTLLDSFCRVLFNAVIGTFLKDFLLRLINLGLILLFCINLIDFDRYILLYILSYAVPSIVMIIYLIGKGELRFTGFGSFIDKNLRKQIISLSLFGIIAGLSGIAIANIDKYMVNDFEGLGSAGIYSIAVYFATLILIPGRALGKASVPVIAEAWKRNDLKEISMVYSKSSINQFLFGMLIFLGISGNLDNIFRILPPEYGAGGMVVILFGLANLINTSSGVSANIMGTSHIYRIQTYLMIFLIALVITTNIIFIPLLGISGAALASLISMVFYTGLRVFILKRKFGLWPYNIKHLVTIILGAVTYLLVSLVPPSGLIPDLILRSFLISIIFGAGVYLLNISVEVNAIGRTIISFFKRDQ